MDIAEKILQLKKDFDDAREAGKVSRDKEIWEQYQEGGIEKNYYYAFANRRFNDFTYNPLYPIRFISSSGVTKCMYQLSGLTDTKVDIYFNDNAMWAFKDAPTLVTIRCIHVSEETTFEDTFLRCNALKNIKVNGTIGQNFDIHYSPLTAESIVNIIEHLSTTVGGKVLTLKSSAVNKMKFPHTSSESGKIYANFKELYESKPYWTISLA